IRIFLTERNKEMLEHEDYLYNFSVLTSTFMSWRCRVRGCGGSLRTNLDKNIILLQKQHSHRSQKNEIKKLILKDKLKKQKIDSNNVEFEQIIQDVNAEINEDIRKDVNIRNTRDYYIK
ncbi:hypothetical protein COBT_004017, partial [Conglomerata obtusa]